jgi:hypothetical protein
VLSLQQTNLVCSLRGTFLTVAFFPCPSFPLTSRACCCLYLVKDNTSRSGRARDTHRATDLVEDTKKRQAATAATTTKNKAPSFSHRYIHHSIPPHPRFSVFWRFRIIAVPQPPPLPLIILVSLLTSSFQTSTVFFSLVFFSALSGQTPLNPFVDSPPQ